MKWLRAGLALPFAVLVVVVQVFRANRSWLDRQLARKRVASAFKAFIVLTVLAWFIVWLLADDHYRQNLNRAVKSYWTELKK